MTEFNLGVLSAYATINDAPFNAAYPKLVAKFRALFKEATTAAGGVDKLDTSLAAAADSSSAASASLSRVTASTRAAGTAQTRAAQQAKVFADAQARVNATMAQYAGESAKVQQAALRVAAAEDRLNAVMASGTATTRTLAAAQAQLIGTQERLAAAQMTLSKRFAAMNASALGFGRTLTHKLTTPILAIGIAAGVMATRFDAQMTRIQTQAGASAQSVQSLTKSVLAMKNVQFGPQDLAASLYHLKSVGLDDAAAMKALRVSQDLAAVGGANLEDTTNALAGAWRTGIAGAKNFGQAAATVNSIIGAGNMTLTAFTTALGTGILPSAKTFGLTLKEVGAALALFTDEGVPADAAATRLRMSFSLLGAPTAKATKLLGDIGIGQYQLGNDLRKPNGLILAISDLKDHLDATGMSATQQAALLSRAFGGGRSSSAIMSMINNLDVLKKKQDQVNASTSKYAADVAAQRATPAAKFAIDLANLEKAGVLLGNEILPDLVGVADAATSVARGFNGLSSGAKRFVVIGLAVAALAGPLLRVIGLIGTAGVALFRFSAGARAVVLSEEAMGAASYRFGAAMTRAGGAVGKFGAAIGGAAIGLAIGQMTKDSSEGAKAVGLLGSALAGAALGAQVGGPWGAAIGAAAGAVADLSQIMSTGVKVAISAADAQQAYADSVKNSTHAMAEQTQEQTVAQLAGSHVYDMLDQLHKGSLALGVSYGDLIQAVNGGPQAFNAFSDAMRGTHNILGTFMIKQVSELRTGLQGALSTQRAFNRGLADNAISGFVAAVRKGSNALPRFDGGIQSLKGTVKDTSGVTSTLTGATIQLSSAQTQAWLSGKRLAAAIQDIGGKQMNTAQAEIAMVQGLQGLKSAMDKHSRSILGNTAAELTNRSAILGQIDNVKAYADTLAHGANGAQNFSKAMINGLAAARSHLVSDLGVSGAAFDTLIAKMHLTPKDIRTTVHVDATQATQVLSAVMTEIQGLHNKTIYIYAKNAGAGSRQTSASQTAAGSRAVFGRSDGTVPPNTVATVGEGTSTSWEGLVTDSRGRATVYSNPDAKAMGWPAPVGYAGGTQTKAQRAAAAKAAASAAAQTAETRASGALTNVSLDSSSFSFVKFQKQIKAATDAIAGALKAGISKSQYVALQQRLARDQRKGDALERKLGLSIHAGARKLGGSLANLSNVSSPADIRGQLGSLEGLLHQAGLPRSFINGLDAENKHILALVKVRDQAARGLAKANSAMASAVAHENADYHNFASATRGAFDITNPVASGKRITQGSLRAGEAQALTRVRRWVSGITQLAGKHIFPASYLRQLAGAGPTDTALATVNALLSMSGSSLRDFASQEQQIAQLSGQGARVVAGRLDSHQLRVADRRVQQAQKHEDRRQERLEHAIETFGERIETAIEHQHIETILKGSDLVVALRGGAKASKARSRSGHNPIWGLQP